MKNNNYNRRDNQGRSEGQRPGNRQESRGGQESLGGQDRRNRYDRRDRGNTRNTRDTRDTRDTRVTRDTRESMETQEFIENRVEGRNPVLEAIRSNRTIEKLLVARGAGEGSIREILGKAREKGIIIQEVVRQRLDEISDSDAHQGVIAYVTPYEYVEVEDLIKRGEDKGEPPFIVILDEITDPHNLGAIIRTAECCGAHGIIIPKRRSVGLTPAAIKASAGAVEYLPLAKVTNLVSTLEDLKKRGFWIAGADIEGDSYTNQDLTGPIAVVVGSEGKGIGRLIKEKCDFLVSIPIKGSIDSLNASVAAGILMYEVVRQRG